MVSDTLSLGGGEKGLQPLWNKLWGGLAPSKISVSIALVESLEIF